MAAWLRRLVAVAVWGAAGAGALAACPPRYDITFADGGRGCLDESPLGGLRPPGQMSSLLGVVPVRGFYHVALPREPARCPAAIGYAALDTSSAWIFDTQASQRERAALQSCQQSAGRPAAPGSPCECIVVLADGSSPLPRAQFEQIAGAAGARAQAPPAAAAPASPGAVPPPAQAPLAAAAPAPASASRAPGLEPAGGAPAAAAGPAAAQAAGAAAPGPSAAQLEALRQELALLRTQLAQQASPAGQPGGGRAGAPRLRTRALVVGNSAYSGLGALANPRRDAEAIASKLRGFGIEVDLVLDADRVTLVKALNDYLARSAGTDVNLFFYAGHGVQVGGINYLIPVDLALNSASVGSIRLNAVSLNDALEYLPARTRVIFLDACRDNPLSRSLLASRSSAGIGLAPLNTTSGTLVAYATKDGSTAEDGAGRNSPYTTALLQHLDADEDIAVVLRRVRQAVLATTNHRQEPWEYGSLVGEQLILSRLGR